MTTPYRKPGECLPDRPMPPAVVLPRPQGKRMWINLLQGRGRDLRRKPGSWSLVEILIGIAAVAVLATIVVVALTADLSDLENNCSCNCSPQPCTCSCENNHHPMGRRRLLWDD